MSEIGRVICLCLVYFFSVHCYGQEMRVQRDISYSGPGQNIEEQKLDMYLPLVSGSSQPLPLVVYVHGGGWAGGARTAVGEKAKFFTSLGWAFASVGYRLSPLPYDTGNAQRIMHPIHAEDIALALAFLYRRAYENGLDSSKIALIGHSAGAHLVNLVSTNSRLLAKNGLTLGVLKGTCSLDAGVFDLFSDLGLLPLAGATADYRHMLVNAFGSDTSLWRDASPNHHIGSGQHPPMLMIHQNTQERLRDHQLFHSLMTNLGYKVDLFMANGFDHNDINRRVGDAAYPDYNTRVEEFFRAVFQVPSSADTDMEESELRIWPNPFDDIVRVSGLTTGDQVQVVSAGGGILVERCSEGPVEILDELSTRLVPGAYLLVIRSKEGGVRTKLIARRF